MKHLLKIDHIGYAVYSIEETSKHYVGAGWKMSDIYEENVQHARIAFLTKEGSPTIELVSSLFDGDNLSPVKNILKDRGVSPYHICYEVEDIMHAVEDLYDEGFRPLFMPVESVAMENRKICYLYHSEVGTIELVESI